MKAKVAILVAFVIIAVVLLFIVPEEYRRFVKIGALVIGIPLAISLRGDILANQENKKANVEPHSKEINR
ncbi:hypothetical protein [Macrococcoides caseolyticum]|uniref:hypothetical protein n=1 Tax=Macrococcoides caseolyticum TaxID=69966 RepID=UPI001F1E344B|nr:hypothetical protein [Macrococcus caseolyticus]MCE4956244.1 hypothetical protein [Macrococcus caseolyticus]